MSVHVTANPSAELPGSVIGKPVHLPYFLFCTMGGERPCGKVWTANTQEQFLLKSAERREHEATCKGGLIVTGEASVNLQPDGELKLRSVLPEVIAGQAAEAADSGSAIVGAMLLGDTGELVRYLVYPSGSVTTLTEGWQPVMENGEVYSFARTADA